MAPNFITGLPAPRDFKDINDISQYLSNLYAGLTRWHFSRANDPTADQKDALAGTAGAPSASNKYVTNSDSRLSGGGSTPSGNGFVHITDGVEDGAAKLVEPTDLNSDVYGTPGASAPGDSAASGAAATIARSDHKHSRETFGTTAGTVCQGSDSRLSDSRTPTSHGNSLHTTGVAAGASAPGDSAAEGSSASVARADHRHSRESFGTASGTICQGNDSRLSDSRTPTAHATTHKSGQSDAIKLDEFAAPTDNTNLNVGTSAHGLCPKAPNTSAQFLDGTGNWSAPVGTSGGTKNIASGSAVTIHNDASKTTNLASYYKVKEMKVNETWSGSIIVNFNLFSDGTHTAYGKVYLNGSAKSSEFTSTTATPGIQQQYTLTGGINNGDLIQIYIHAQTAGQTVGAITMTLQYKWQITAIGGLTLSAALDTTDATVISTTNQDP